MHCIIPLSLLLVHVVVANLVEAVSSLCKSSLVCAQALLPFWSNKYCCVYV